MINKRITLLFIFAFQLCAVQSFWDGEKFWYVEHQFKTQDAQFEINKAYSGGGYTFYDFRLKKLESDIRGLRVAFQWVLADGTYKGMAFQMSIPESGQKDGGKVLERLQSAQYYPNQNNAPLTEYLKELVLGNYLIDEYPEMEDLETRVNRNGDIDGTVVQISFKVPDHEPLGRSRFWMAWEQYNEYNACIATDTCLTTERMIYSKMPFVYYNGLNFGNSINRSLLMNCYWIMAGSSLFWLLGSPLNLFLYFFMNAYVQWISFLGMFKVLVAAGGGYEEYQNDFYSAQNYFLEQLIYWQSGTFLVSSFMVLMINSLPILGPIFGLLIVICVQPFVML